MLDDEALPGGLSDAASAAWLTRRYGLQSVASRTGGVGELRQTVGEEQAVTRALAAKGCQLGHRFTHA
ncbi:hypothetical protein DIPPA_09955 [Diplonema papillatum]|nr:hypothetical protein DIPPA_09955 [Diplonema papillatum]